MAEVMYPLFGEVFGIGIGNDAECLATQCEFGLSEECFVGSGNESTCHIENGVGRSALDLRCEFLSLAFEFGAERFRHDGSCQG